MDKETIVAYVKMFVLWAVTGVEWLTNALPKIALLLTITYTAAQLYVLWRDRLSPSRLSRGKDQPPSE